MDENEKIKELKEKLKKRESITRSEVIYLSNVAELVHLLKKHGYVFDVNTNVYKHGGVLKAKTS